MNPNVKIALVIGGIIGKSAIFIYLIWSFIFGVTRGLGPLAGTSDQTAFNASMFLSFLVILFFTSEFVLQQIRLNRDV